MEVVRHGGGEQVGGHGEEQGVGEGQGVVEVGVMGPGGGEGPPAPPGVGHGVSRRLLHILLQLLQVPLVLRPTVLEPANNLEKK